MGGFERRHRNVGIIFLVDVAATGNERQPATSDNRGGSWFFQHDHDEKCSSLHGLPPTGFKLCIHAVCDSLYPADDCPVGPAGWPQDTGS